MGTTGRLAGEAPRGLVRDGAVEVLNWRVYYPDGSTFDSTQGGPEDAPALGVQATVCSLEGVPITNTRADFYWWEPFGWVGGDIFGLMQYLQEPGWKRVLFGRTITNARHDEIIAKASHDKDFGEYR